MRKEVEEAAQLQARAKVDSWKASGRQFVSIIDGVPTPWEAQPLKLIMADAKRRGLEVLCIADPSHMEVIISAMMTYLELNMSKPLPIDPNLN